MAMNDRHVGDTTEWRISNRPSQQNLKRRWSPMRAWAVGIALTATVIFVGSLIGHPGHRVVAMSDPVGNALRALCVMLIMTAGAITAYEVISPKIWRRHATIRMNQAVLEERILLLEHKIDRLVDEIGSYGSDKRQSGYEAAMRDNVGPAVPPQRGLHHAHNGLRSI